jgi:hypothetical protein
MIGSFRSSILASFFNPFFGSYLLLLALRLDDEMSLVIPFLPLSAGISR